MRTRIIDTIKVDDLLNNRVGIFKTIQETSSQPFEWLNASLSHALDRMFYLEHSGNKYISPLYVRLLKAVDDYHFVDTTPYTTMAKIIIERFKDKWNKLYDAFIESEYKPLDNYNMLQVETPNITKNRTEKTNTDITTTSNGSSDSSTHGFNSNTPVATDSTDIGNTTGVTGDKDDNYTETDESETGTRRLERSGNIGVTTSQQMLQSEIDLRKNYNFTNMILNDVASVMCLFIY